MSKLTVTERARLYVDKIPPAVSGSGGHNATFTVACALVKGFDLSIDEARPLLQEYNLRCSPPWNDAEIEHKLKQADGVRDEKARGWLRDADYSRDDGPSATPLPSRAANVALPPATPVKPAFHAETLRVFASRWRQFVDTAWLADRSPVLPYELTASEFLGRLFRDGEKVVVFTNQESQGQAIWPMQAAPSGGDKGVWYLAQPVDGREHANPRVKANDDGTPRMSRRSEESVTSWRHLVLESDEADARDWMGALVQLPLRIAAIYTSGDRSIHALVRVDAPTKQEWDNCVKQIRPVLVTFGADPKAMSAVRLSRLPGCLRGDKLQKLLYLAPEPEAAPICARPRLRNVLEHWLTWLPTALSITPAEVRAQECWSMVEMGERALEWYASSAAAREMLGKLRAWKGDEE